MPKHKEQMYPGMHKAVESKPKRKKAIKNAMKHKDVLGAGAKKRKALKNPEDKIKTVMHEFGRGTLYSGSGAKVKNPKQALAIGYSEARKKAGKKKKR